VFEFEVYWILYLSEITTSPTSIRRAAHLENVMERR